MLQQTAAMYTSPCSVLSQPYIKCLLCTAVKWSYLLIGGVSSPVSTPFSTSVFLFLSTLAFICAKPHLWLKTDKMALFSFILVYTVGIFPYSFCHSCFGTSVGPSARSFSQNPPRVPSHPFFLFNHFFWMHTCVSMWLSESSAGGMQKWWAFWFVVDSLWCSPCFPVILWSRYALPFFEILQRAHACLYAQLCKPVLVRYFQRTWCGMQLASFFCPPFFLVKLNSPRAIKPTLACCHYLLSSHCDYYYYYYYYYSYCC